MNAGFTITKQGWRLLAKMVAGATLEISRVMVGSGKLAEGINPGELTDLVQPVALATSTVPQVADKQVSFIVEYRSDLNGDRRESSEPQSGESGGLAEGFWLNEFGVFANDPDEGEVLLYYATMGDYPQYVSAYNGSSVDIRRYPVSIALSDCEDVQLSYPAGALVTAEEMAAAFAERGVPPGGLEGQMLVKAGAGSATPTKWGPWPSNQNLLLNGDFRKPVNRNGKSEYTDAGYTIDGWQKGNALGSVQVGNNKLTLLGSELYYSTLIDGLSSILGQIITYSWLTDTNVLYAKTIVLPSEMPVEQSRLSFSIHDSLNLEIWILSNKKLALQWKTLFESISLIAAKLELGPVQTLAHKDANGNWVLNDPPNYDLQYALCSQYSPITGEFVGSQHSNDNLLDNAYWADKNFVINQRGQEEYTGAGYTIDGWWCNAIYPFSIENVGIKISGTNLFRQKFDKDFMNGKWLTFSVLLSNNSLKSAYLQMPTSITNNRIDIEDRGFRFVKTANDVYVETWNKTENSQDILVAAKLELGDQQTLAHKDANGNWVLNDPPPNKALELAKCQRYFDRLQNQTSLSAFNVAFGSKVSNSLCQFTLILPVPMRNKPVISVSDITKLSIFSGEKTATITSLSSESLCNNMLRINAQGDFTNMSYNEPLIMVLANGAYIDKSADL